MTLQNDIQQVESLDIQNTSKHTVWNIAHAFFCTSTWFKNKECTTIVLRQKNKPCGPFIMFETKRTMRNYGQEPFIFYIYFSVKLIGKYSKVL